MASQHIGLDYRIYDPGSKASLYFNQPSNSDNVGMLTSVTGLDSPEIRESAEDLIQADGGVHGMFLFGRRPIVLSGVINGVTSPADRAAKAARISSVTNMLRHDGELIWTDVDGITKYVTVRRNGPVRVEGGWNKTFQIPLIAADSNIYNYTQTLTTVPYLNVTNLLLDPSGEVTPATTHFSYGHSSGTFSSLNRVAGGRPQTWGTQATELTVTGMTAGSWLMPTTEYVTVSPNSRLWCQTWGRNMAGGGNTASAMVLLVEFATSAGAYVTGLGVGNTITNPVSDQWYNLEGAITVPSTAGLARLCVYTVTADAGTYRVQMDDSMIVQSPTYSGPHFNGHEAGARWNGTPGNSTSTIHGQGYVSNLGTAPTFPTVRLSGGLSNPRIVNVTQRKQVFINGASMASTGSTLFDNNRHQVHYNGENWYHWLLPTAKQWWWLDPGQNLLRFLGDGTPTGTPSMSVTHRDAWI